MVKLKRIQTMIHKQKFALTALKMRENYNLLFIIISFFIFAIDQFTKYFIRTNFPLGASFQVIKNMFHLTYTYNTGISFGLFKGINWLFTLLSILAFFLFIYIYLKNKKYWLQLSFIIAGISGNLTNRILLGHVVDFIDFRIWPIFNLADAVITIGVVWLIIKSTRNKEDIVL
jgi:signal peptidase II